MGHTYSSLLHSCDKDDSSLLRDDLGAVLYQVTMFDISKVNISPQNRQHLIADLTCMSNLLLILEPSIQVSVRSWTQMASLSNAKKTCVKQQRQMKGYNPATIKENLGSNKLLRFIIAMQETIFLPIKLSHFQTSLSPLSLQSPCHPWTGLVS